LMRVAIGAFQLGDLQPGKWREILSAERDHLFDSGL
jgi:16S rRNA U516 pseudouridylate synthase RsuA-like enzyme